MKTREDIEAYLVRSGFTHQGVGEDTWIVRVERDKDPVVVRLQESLILVRADVGPVPKRNREKFYQGLLRLNAESLVHVSYGLSGEKVILSGALPLENLDYNEFISTLDDMGMALDRDLSTVAAND
jgi:hypothetical protein